MCSIGEVSWWACKFCAIRETCVMKRTGMIHAKVEGHTLICEWFQDDGFEDPLDVTGKAETAELKIPEGK